MAAHVHLSPEESRAIVALRCVWPDCLTPEQQRPIAEGVNND